MAGKDIIKMTQEELKRLHIIKKAIDKSITQIEVTDIIDLSQRQIGRLVKRVREEGDTGIVHRARGKKSNRAFSQELKDKVIRLYKSKYHDFGPTLATEKLFEIDKIKISEETLRKWLITGDISYKKRKKRPHRQWRERKSHLGIMIQMDGSHHDWFEGRGPKCVFMGYIDDATNNVFGGFYSYEGTVPAMDSFKRYIEKYGIPMSIYVDKHTTYKSTAKLTMENELNNTKPLSQFERALKELEVEVIHAHSPQAKGRVERLFNTLQDRLIKEMRLIGIKSIEKANEFLEKYLPKYNKRFSIKPKEKEDMHRVIPKGLDLDKILCIKTKRTLRNDFTVAHNCKLYQVEDKLRAKKVVIEEKIDGSMLITHKGRSLKYKEVMTRPQKKEEKKLYIFTPKKKNIPPANHPWRKYKINKSSSL